jgi:hypothetical protein
MLPLMLDPRFKTHHFVSSLITCEQGKTIVEKYDKKSLFFILIKCHYHLHSLVEFERDIVNQGIEEDDSLDIFEMIANSNEPTIELIDIKLLIFKHYQVDVKKIKCPLQWKEKHENMFPIVGFYVKQVLEIIRSQIGKKSFPYLKSLLV